MEKLDAISSWIKSNPLVVTAGALTTVFAFIISTSNVIPVVLKALNLPDCLTYADVYHDSWSDFKHEGDKWREYPREGGTYRYEFRETHRTRGYIELLNLTPLLQIERVKPFGEPAVDRSEKLARLIALALVAPEPRHAHCCTEFPGLRLLLARYRERTLEIGFRFSGSRLR